MKKEHQIPPTSNNFLAQPISALHGVGDKITETLATIDIHSLFDLLLRVPKAIIEQVETADFGIMQAGRHYIVSGKVVAVKNTRAKARRRLEAVVQDIKGDRISVVFFGNAVNYAEKILRERELVWLSGEAKNFLGRIQLVHPKLLTNKMDAKPDTNLPTYSQLNGIQGAAFKRLVDKAILALKNDSAIDHIDENFLKAHRLAALKPSLMAVHQLHNQDTDWDRRNSSPYFRRLAFEEMLSFYLRLDLERKNVRRHSHAFPKPVIENLLQNFLPFNLTTAQKRVAQEIIDDMCKPEAMSRLVQGDVGSGKTAVSAIAALHAAESNSQTALMAPTEILAEQLFNVYQGFFKNKPFSLALLTSNTKSQERKRIVAGLLSREISILIGTHALLSDDIKFGQLGLVIIDEQHRFGVKQRTNLLTTYSDSQNFCPHLLVMSATPIPRSLALTFYGDLDLSVIDERPPGRVAIHTQMLTGPVLDTLVRLCERIILTKQKAFIVFPLVLESEHLDLENATKALQFLHDRFGQEKALLLHGKMKADEKILAMNKFRESSINFLVSTTVVEVGVDIPDATCMIIIHPERFGLAQLHQLRGRVGRKDLKSFCFLVTDIANKFSPAYQRLLALCQTDNGFKLAEIDLEIRGPGELLGVKQSGLPDFHIFSHSEFGDLLDPAKSHARELLSRGLKSEHHHLFVNKSARFC
jgi:ATP-dependent DNA helicase RecG